MSFSTKTFAEHAGVEQQTVRGRVCQTGSYFGIVPSKLINGRLLWPDDALVRLTLATSEPGREQQAARKARKEKTPVGNNKAA